MRIRPGKPAVGVVVVLGAALYLLVGCNKAPEKKEEAVAPAPAPVVKPGPDVKVSAAVRAKAENPKPGPKAHKRAAGAIGRGKASVAGKGHAKADQVYWAEEVDLDDSGNPVVTDVALDKKHKVLYFSKERTFSCASGGTADGEVLIAVYGKANTLDKPPGSGWYVTELDAGECAVATAGLYGCRFDSAGVATECGSATVQEETDDIMLVPALAAPPTASAPPPKQ